MKNILSTLFSIISCLIAGPSLLAQNGDKEGHDMKPPPAHWKIPAAPVVTAARAPATFAVEDGFRIELVAAEPLIHDPVAIAFDGNGRIWVAEMRGFMPNIDGKGEHEPVGRISVLEDSNGDGKIDRNVVFLEGIVLPRTVAFADADKTLVYADDNDLYEVSIIETDGGLPKAGKPKIIDKNFSSGGNPEHKPNGMRYTLDNWYYNAKSDQRYRKIDGEWVKEETEFRGQWGIDQDDYGRLFTNTNSNCVTAEELAPGLKLRNPNHAFRDSADAKIKNQSLWASRINPGINRGYLKGYLNDEGYLTRPTAVSGLAVYRGDQFPADYYGNLFINEPGANLVKRAIVRENEKGELEISSAYEGREFFTSTDERSRIVNSYTAPDGTLYLVDLYRGILQHGAYVTTYLRRQILERALDKPVGLGRIWRVVHEGKDRGPQPQMIGASNEELAGFLGHPNGWWRDTAQQLLVQRGDASAAGPVRKVFEQNENPLTRIHAIWTLEGLGQMTAGDVATGLKSQSPHAVAESIRAAESFADSEEAAKVLNLFKTAAGNDSFVVRRQLLASLGLFHEQPDALPLLAELVADSSNDKLAQDLALSGLHGAEFNFLNVVLKADPKNGITQPLITAVVAANDPKTIASIKKLAGGNLRLAQELASASVVKRNASLIKELFAAAAESESQREPVVTGMLAARKAIGGKYKPIALGKELPALIATAGLILPEQNLELSKMFDFSGAAKANFLRTDAEKKQFALGQKHYERICMACHQPHGRGQGFVAPPLVDSEWVMGSEKRLISLVMDGMMGPVTVDGELYDIPDIQPMMPGLRMNPEVKDEDLAAILTYVRNAWGNAASVVKTESLKQFREASDLRAPYTEKELKDVK